jgi:hypothetical protein
MHGTAMPGSQLDTGERAAVIAFVRTLIPDGAEDRLVQVRETIRVRRVDEGALAGPGEPDWGAVVEVCVRDLRSQKSVTIWHALELDP